MIRVFRETLADGLCRLGLSGKPKTAHSSLRSFAHVEDSAETVIHLLQNVCSTVLAFGFQCAAEILPPPEKPYCQAGCDYTVLSDFVNPTRPFDVRAAP